MLSKSIVEVSGLYTYVWLLVRPARLACLLCLVSTEYGAWVARPDSALLVYSLLLVLVARTIERLPKRTPRSAVTLPTPQCLTLPTTLTQALEHNCFGWQESVLKAPLVNHKKHLTSGHCLAESTGTQRLWLTIKCFESDFSISWETIKTPLHNRIWELRNLFWWESTMPSVIEGDAVYQPHQTIYLQNSYEKSG